MRMFHKRDKMKFLIPVFVLGITASAFIAGMRAQEYVDNFKRDTALIGCEAVASQILKDAIIAEHKFNVCNNIFEDLKAGLLDLSNE